MFNLQMKLSPGRKGRMSFHVWAVRLCLEYQSEARYKAPARQDYLTNLVGPKRRRLRDQKVWDLCRKPRKSQPQKSQISGHSAEFRDFQGNQKVGEEPGEVGLFTRTLD